MSAVGRFYTYTDVMRPVAFEASRRSARRRHLAVVGQERSFQIEGAEQAHDALVRDQHVGKLVLRID